MDNRSFLKELIENHSIFQQDIKVDNHSFMKEFIENPGYSQIVRNISSFLDVKSLAQCRLVCQAWKDLIDNDRPWLVFQLEHIHDQQKTFVTIHATEDNRSVKTTIRERFPEWYIFIQQISRKQSIPRLKEIVRQMWIYLGRIFVFNQTPLHYAIVSSDTEFVQLLVDCGIDLTMTDPDQWTPMYYACYCGQLAIVQLLLKHQPTFKTNSRGQTIFHLAAYNEYPQVLKLILDTFRFEDVRDNDGWTMIHQSVAVGPKETIQFLLESRQKIGFNLEARTKEGDTILHIACLKRDIEIVDLVFKALEDINSDIGFETRNYHQHTPLHYACRNQKSRLYCTKPEVAIQLLERFPQKICILGQNDAHILHYACELGHLELIKYITLTSDFEVDFNVVADGGCTPLHLACWHGRYEIVKFLFQNYDVKGIDVTLKNNFGQTAEDLARQNGHQDILKVLETWKNEIK